MVDFSDFFVFARPENISSIALKYMTSGLDKNNLNNLLDIALAYMPYDKKGRPILNQALKSKVEELGLKEGLKTKLSNYGTIKSDEPSDFELQRRQENEDIKRKNEELFASLTTDDEILDNVDPLWIANLFYIVGNRKNEYLEPDTVLRLKNLMKNVVYKKRIFAKEASLSRLAKRVKEDWNIDKIYYTSASLNEPKELFDIQDKDFLSYLYMLSVINHVVGNVIKNNFHNALDEYDPEFTLSTLKTYLRVAVKKYIPEATNLFIKYIFKNNNLKAMKYIVSHFFYDARNGLIDNLFKAVGFNISAKDLYAIKGLENINDDLIAKIDALIAFREESAVSFTQLNATALFGLIQHSEFIEIRSEDKLKLVDYMMSAFDTPKSIKHTNGAQSPWQLCASFVRNDSLSFLPSEYLPELLERHNSDDDIWKNRILDRISDVAQEDADKAFEFIEVENLKEFVNSGGIINNRDFFEDVYLKIETLKYEIENNRNNEKDPFYNSDGKPKNEELCRDEILRALSRYYGDKIAITKEQHEANNRVDLNIKLKENLDFEVQVECKKDENKDLYPGVKDQLINKYMNGCEYGIYLVFYFGKKSMKNDNMIKRLKANIPDEYKEFVKVIYIDLS